LYTESPKSSEVAELFLINRSVISAFIGAIRVLFLRA